MSALRKWALGGLIGCVAGIFVFGTVMVTGVMPAAKILAYITYAVGIAGIFGVVVKLPDWLNSP